MTDISDRPSIVLRAPRAVSAWRAGDPVLWATVLAVFAAYTALAVSRYVTDQPDTDDLGIFTEAIKQYAHFHAPVVDLKGAGFNLLGDHWHPLLAILAPLWWLAPSPVTLLVAQAACTALSVIPVYRAAAYRLPRGEARIIAAAYGFSWGLAELNWFDFHEVALAVPLLACALSALVCGRTWAGVWWALPLVMVKENLGFTVAGIGLVLLLQRRWRPGALLAVWGIGWSLVEVLVLIPHFNPHGVYPYWDRGPTMATLAAGAEWKLPTIVLILLPTVGLALRSPLAAVAVPPVALHMISSNHTYWLAGSHHNATVTPIVFCAAVDGLARLRAARIDGTASRLGVWFAVRGPAMMAAVAVAMVFQSPLANLWHSSTWQVTPGARAVEAAQALIPPGKVVDSTIRGDDRLVPRDDVLSWDRQNVPDYILFDQAPDTPWPWLVPPSVPATWFPGTTYRTVFHRGSVWLFERVRSTQPVAPVASAARVTAADTATRTP